MNQDGNERMYHWTATVERFKSRDDEFSAKIKLTGKGRKPQIGDLVKVRGRKGAEFIAPIVAIRHEGHKNVHVVTEYPPWVADSYLARQERSRAEALRTTLEARKDARLMDVRQQLNLCVVCGEGDLAACACVRAEQERVCPAPKSPAFRFS